MLNLKIMVTFLLASSLVISGSAVGQTDSSTKKRSSVPTGDQRPLVGIHDIQLADGVSESDFDTFVKGPLAELWENPIGGIQLRVYKGDRGAANGKYRLAWEFESVACRNRYFPSDSEVAQAFQDDVQSKLTDVQTKFDSMFSRTAFTDFVILFATDPVADTDARSLYGVHDIALLPGVSAETFESFVTGPYAQAWKSPIGGIGHMVMKGDRGEETGQYKLVYRFTPASLRDEYIPQPTRISDVFRDEIMPKMPQDLQEKFSTMVEDKGFTDYAPIGK